MKKIYSEIHAISRHCSTLYGPGIFTTNLLLIYYITQYGYLTIVKILENYVEVNKIFTYVFSLLPSTLKCLYLYAMCNKCSERVSLNIFNGIQINEKQVKKH